MSSINGRIIHNITTSGPVDLTREPFPVVILPYTAETLKQVEVKYYDESDIADITDETATYTLYDEYGSPVVLTDTSQPIKIDGPIILKFTEEYPDSLIFLAEEVDGVMTDTVGGAGSLTFHNAVCGTVTTASEFLFTGLTGSETVVSSGGTAVPSIVAGKIVFTGGAGTVWNIQLSNGWTIPVSSGAGTGIYGYKSDGTNIIGTISVADINAFWAGTQDEYFHDWEYGYANNVPTTEMVADVEFATPNIWDVVGGGGSVSGGQALLPNVNSFVRDTNIPLQMTPGLYLVTLDIAANAGIVRAYNTAYTATVGKADFVGTGIQSAIMTVETSSSIVTLLAVNGGAVVNSYSIKKLPVGNIPANPYTGLSVLGQVLSVPAKNFRSVSWSYPYSLILANVDQDLGGDYFYDSIDGITPLVRDYDGWKALDDGNQHYIGVTRQIIAIYDPAVDALTDIKIKSYLGI